MKREAFTGFLSIGDLFRTILQIGSENSRNRVLLVSSLCKISRNNGSLRPVFSRIGTESQILSLYGKYGFEKNRILVQFTQCLFLFSQFFPVNFVKILIKQLQQLNTETNINANVEKNMLGKKGLHLNRNGLKQFAKNLIDAIRELRK